jgi:hypothetical protein
MEVEEQGKAALQLEENLSHIFIQNSKVLNHHGYRDLPFQFLLGAPSFVEILNQKSLTIYLDDEMTDK